MGAEGTSLIQHTLSPIHHALRKGLLRTTHASSSVDIASELIRNPVQGEGVETNPLFDILSGWGPGACVDRKVHSVFDLEVRVIDSVRSKSNQICKRDLGVRKATGRDLIVFPVEGADILVHHDP